MRLEPSPAWKAVFPGDGELRVRELRGALRRTQLLQAMLRRLAEPFEIWTSGE
jgi:hypothetical protein